MTDADLHQPAADPGGGQHDDVLEQRDPLDAAQAEPGRPEEVAQVPRRLRQRVRGEPAARLEHAAVPVLDFVPALARSGLIPGGSSKNLASVSPFCTWGRGIDDIDRAILADAQTSGGLLIAVPADQTDTLVRELGQRSTPARAVIGKIVAGEPGNIEVA